MKERKTEFMEERKCGREVVWEKARILELIKREKGVGRNLRIFAFDANSHPSLVKNCFQ